MAGLLLACFAFISADRPADSLPLYPTDVEVSDDGSVFISHRNSKDVRHYDASGKMLGSWTFSDPVTSLALDGERLYVTGSYAEGWLSCINIKANSSIKRRWEWAPRLSC